MLDIFGKDYDMKITKSVLKQIIAEEIGSDPAMMKAINKLTDSIEGLDVSIDYLSSAVTGEDPFTVGSMQKALGRFATPRNKKGSIEEGHGGEGSMAVRQLNNLSQMVQELQGMVDESDDHEEWVESKITKAHDYINTVLNYLSGADSDFEPTNAPYRRVAEQEIDEILYSDSDVGDYVTDFRKSKAPQFKGKSKEKRTQMAVAAALDAKDKKKKKRGKK